MSKISWFFIGFAGFGLCVGLYVGLSVSPIVNSVVSLLFAFLGGSIVLLIKDRTNDELNKIGASVFVMSLMMIIGALGGMNLRGDNSLYKDTAYIELNDDEFIDYIFTLVGRNKDNDENNNANIVPDPKICLIVKNKIKNDSLKISQNKLKELILDHKINKDILSIILGNNVPCYLGDKSKLKGGSIELHSKTI